MKTDAHDEKQERLSKMIMNNMGGNIVIRNVEDGAEALLSLPRAPNPTI